MAHALLTFGHGFVAEALARRLGWPLFATSRDPDRRRALEAAGARALDPADTPALADALRQTRAVLVSAAPDDGGCPGLKALAPALARSGAYPDWIGYLSSTSVYGDLEGGWAFESSPLKGRSVQAVRRTAAERDWQDLARGMGLTLTVFRLGAIYGPGRSPLDRPLKEVMDKPGQVFSRAHADDIAAALQASIQAPRPGAIYNVVDDEPASAVAVADHAAALLGRAAPPRTPFDESGLSDPARRFWQECRRVSNARLKAELGWRPQYPSYREGLSAIAASSSTAAVSR